MRPQRRPLPAALNWLAPVRERLRLALASLIPRADSARRSFLIGASVSALAFAAGCASSVRAPAPVADTPPFSPLETPQPRVRLDRSNLDPVKQGDSLPAFPWQPPRPTARLELPVFRGARYDTLGKIADGLASAARQAGLRDVTYFSVPGGFAILLRPERIDANLAPLVPRHDSKEAKGLDALFSFLSGVFASTIDRRQFAFIVTNQTIEPSADLVDYTPSQLEAAFGRGADALPESLRRAPRPAGCKVTAMVYHFRRRRDDRLDQSFASLRQEPATAREHLRQAGLRSVLA